MPLNRIVGLTKNGPVLIALFVLIINVSYITGLTTPNPLVTRSGLAQQTSHGPVKRGYSTIDPNDGYTTQALGRLASNDLIHGKLPWWNPYEGVGVPLAGEMQSAAYFPLTLLLLTPLGTLLIHIVLEIIAGVATYELVKKIGANKWVSVLGGVVFAANGTFAWLANSVVNPIAFLPVMLLGVEYAANKPKSAKAWILIALGLALSLYAGFPEVAFIDGAFVVFWAIIRYFWLEKAKGLRKPYFLSVLVGVVVGLLLSAPILNAFIGYLPYAYLGLHSTANSMHLPLIALPALFMPYVYGPIFGYFPNNLASPISAFWGGVGGYVTGSIFALAIYGLFFTRRRIVKFGLLAWILIGVFSSYGILWFDWVMAKLPIVSQAAYWRYFMPSISMAVVLLVCVALMDWENSPPEKKKIYLAGLVSLIFVGAAVIYSFYVYGSIVHIPHFSKWWIVSIAWLVFVSLGIFLSILKKNKYAIAALVAVDVFLMFLAPTLSAPSHYRMDYRPVRYLQRHLGQYRFFTLGPIAPNYGSYFGIASVNNNDLPIPKLWAQYIHTHLYSNVSPILFTGFSLSNPNGQTPLNAFETNIKSYEALGTKYLVAPSVFKIYKGQLERLGLKRVFMDDTTIIFQLPQPLPLYSATGGCTIISYSTDAINLNCKQNAILVRRELYFNGWQVNINGSPAKIVKVNAIFQGVKISKGNNKVVFNYQPTDNGAANLLVILGLVLVAIALTLNVNNYQSNRHAIKL